MADLLLEGLSKAVSVVHADMASLPQSRSCSITLLPCARGGHNQHDQLAQELRLLPGAAVVLAQPLTKDLATSATSVLGLLCPGICLFCPGDEFQGESQDFVLIILAACRVES